MSAYHNDHEKVQQDEEINEKESKNEKATEFQKPVNISCADKVRKLLQAISFGKFEMPLSL
jgi:hypothetical protein